MSSIGDTLAVPPASPSARPTATRRRTSSVGKFMLGDSVPGLSTMNATDAQKAGSESRQRALSNADSVSGAGAGGADRNGGASGSPPVTGVNRLYIQFRELCYRKTWVLPLLLSVIPLVAFLLYPTRDESNPLYPYLLPYYRVEPDTPGGKVMYGKGKKDFCFVFYYMFVLSFVREFMMQQVLEPLAKKAGIVRPNKIKRFMEQTYMIFYYSFTTPWGLYIMYHMPLWYFKTTPMYEHYPHKTHEFNFKLYYLVQAAFWSQQSVVLALQLEKPRKDFKELVFHHIVTIALIFCSYRFHFTWIGLGIYITMDASDLMLSISKTLHYLNSPITEPFVFVFMGSWIYLRHYLNLKIMWSVATEFRTVGDFTLNWETQQYKCWISQYITFALLSGLQAVNLYWLFLILRIVYRVVFYDISKDDRSDDEDEEEEEQQQQQVSAQPTEGKKSK